MSEESCTQCPNKWLLIARRLRTACVVTLSVVASLVFALFSGLRAVEKMVTFHPEPAREGSWSVPRNAQEVWFNSNDGIRLNGWYLPSSAERASATIIYFHGNAGNISNVGWIGEVLAENGFNVLLFDYRGYGKSEGAIVGEEDLYADSDAAYNYAARRGEQPSKLFLYGQSLGTAAAIELASRRATAGLIVESGFSSAGEMAGSMLPWLPRWLYPVARNRFESRRRIASVHCPVLLVHGDPDETIPLDQGRALYAAANEPKQLVLVPGGGHNVAGFAGRPYLVSLSHFMKSALEAR